MAAIPLWLIGRTVTAVVVTPLVADGDGDLSAAAMGAQSFTAIVDEISYSGRVTTAEISPLSSPRRNEVPIEEDHTLQLTEIMRNGPTLSLGALIWTAVDNPDRALFQFSRGGNSLAVYGVLDSYSETITKTRSTAQLTIRFTDTPGTTNPAYGAAFAG